MDKPRYEITVFYPHGGHENFRVYSYDDQAFDFHGIRFTDIRCEDTLADDQYRFVNMAFSIRKLKKSEQDEVSW